jgi:hypothetical protein
MRKIYLLFALTVHIYIIRFVLLIVEQIPSNLYVFRFNIRLIYKLQELSSLIEKV